MIISLYNARKLTMFKILRNIFGVKSTRDKKKNLSQIAVY